MEQQLKVRKPNSWIEHVKKYALDNNISYRNSVKLARESYNKIESTEKPKRKTTPVKIFKVVEVIEEKPKKVRKQKIPQVTQVPTEIGPILEFIDAPIIEKKVKPKKLKNIIE